MIFALLFLSLCLNLYGIDWGLPSWPLSMLRFKDHFAGANKPVFIYKKIEYHLL